MTNALALYDQIEDLITERSIHGRGRTPEAAHFRSIINPEIKTLRRKLNQMGLPSRKTEFESNSKYWHIATPQWIIDAEQQAADLRDLHDTQECAR
jgi:hypothetical protein